MSLKSVIKELSVSKPNWLAGLRDEALKALEASRFPASDMESWRKISLRNFDPGKYANVPEIFSAEQTVEKLKIQFADEIAGNKLKILSFSAADETAVAYITRRFSELLQKYKDNYFALYALGYFTEGVLVVVDDEAVIEGTLDLDFNMKTSANYFSPLTFVKMGKFSKLDLIESTTSSAQNEAGMIVSLTDLNLAESASMVYTAVETFDPLLFHFRTVGSSQGSHSRLQGFHFHSGGNRGKTFYLAEMNGEGSGLNLNGIAEMSGREFNDIEMRVNHLKGKTESAIRFKTILSGKSHNVFTGNLYIPEKLHHVTASQIVNNLLLDKTARAESIPALEVYSEDIHCTHGATVGELDAELLFYLNARGLDDEEAKSVIVGAFIVSLVEAHPSAAAVARILEILSNKGYNI